MVQVKPKPQHAKVRPPKCVIYMSRNPIKYIIQCHRELFQKDQEARDERTKKEQYKKHVHTPPKEDSTSVKAM